MPQQTELLSPPDVERIYKRSVSSLAKDRLTGAGPRFVKLGSRVFYDRRDVEDWIESLKRTSTSEAPISNAA